MGPGAWFWFDLKLLVSGRRLAYDTARGLGL